MPCTELFDAQPEAYRESVLPCAVRARVAVEAASVDGWWKYVGLDGAVVGMSGFGESAPGDVLFISEKCVACTQRRAIPLADIKPRKLAYKLSAHVTKTPHGIGLGMPETMEMALREVGSLRILFAAAISVIGKKIFRKKGWFYAVAGYRARSIDGPCHNTIPPYNHYVVLGPLKPDQVAKDIAARVGYDVAIVDINDLEGQILGASSKAVNKKLYARILKDNPLGQDDQQTPMGIIRRVD